METNDNGEKIAYGVIIITFIWLAYHLVRLIVTYPC